MASSGFIPNVIAREIVEEARERIEAGCAVKGVERAQATVPVVTGQLRDSIEADGNALMATADYALTVELHEPFLLPSGEEVRDLDLEEIIAACRGPFQ